MAEIPQSQDRSPRRRRRYDAAFKAEALRLAAAGPGARAVAQRLGIGEKQLYRWQEAARRLEKATAQALRAELSSPAAPVLQAWTAAQYAHPNAAPDQAAAALGQQMAAAALATQGLYLFDHRAKQMLLVSAGIERLLGYPAAAFTVELLYRLIHPDDQAIVTEASVLVNNFMADHRADPLSDLVFSVDYRLRHAQGHYLRVLRQNVVVSRDTNGAVVAAAGILTDITAHKRTHDVRFHLNHPDFAAFVRRQQVQSLPRVLSEREQEVLALVLAGHSSSQIGELLSLATSSVQTHRRNIQRKVGSHDLYRLLQHLDADGE